MASQNRYSRIFHGKIRKELRCKSLYIINYLIMVTGIFRGQKMKKRILSLLIAAGIARFAGDATAQTESADYDTAMDEQPRTELVATEGEEGKLIDADLNVQFVDKYVMNRGFLGTDSPSMQLSTGLSTDTPVGNFRVGYWGNIELDNPKGQNDITEHDLLINWGKILNTSMGELELGAGYAVYYVKGGEGLTVNEFTFQAVIDDVVASMFVDVSRDEEGHGLGAQLGYGKSVRLTDEIGLRVDGLVNFNSKYFTDKTGFAGVSGRLALEGPEGTYLGVSRTEAMGALERDSFTSLEVGISQ